MTAVFKHELKNYFHSFTAYVFGAFLLAIVGFGAMLYNLQAAVSNFEYVLSLGSIASSRRSAGRKPTSCCIRCPSPPRRWFWASISPC